MFTDPVFISLYIIVFTCLWLLVCMFLASQLGWNRFAKQHPLPGFPDTSDTIKFGSLQFNHFGSYSYSVNLSFYPEGIELQPLFWIAFHQPLFIRWSEITSMKDGKEFVIYPMLDLCVGNTNFRFYGKTIDKIKQYHQKAQH